MKVSSVEQMRELDRRAITEFGVPNEILMENAGGAVFFHILRDIGAAGRSFCVVCGLGNNGGDGFVVARKLHSTGARVQVLVVGDPAKYSDTSRMNFEMVTSAGIELHTSASVDDVAAGVAACDVVVDGLLGTGLTREVDGTYRDVIDAVNASGKTVVSLDIPSGVDGNTGQVRGVAVRADSTVTFGLPKIGNLLYPGAELGGRLLATHISFPPALTNADHIVVRISTPPPLPPRPADGHKGTFGDALFIAGAANYYGAPTLAALSMLKAGGGYARLAAPRSVTPIAAGLAPEVVFAPQEETAVGSLALASADMLLELCQAVDFVVLGPGLSLTDETQDLIRRLVPEIPRPLLIDGDGLTAVAADLEVVRRRDQPTILTPHPGEMSRVSGVPIAGMREDPIGVVQGTARYLNAVVVLKGAHSLIGYPDDTVVINPSGNSGMASAGSGDVLTGTVAAMYGLGLEVSPAAELGVFLHGVAGDLAAASCGEDGLTARDILEHLPEAVRMYRDEYEELTRDSYGAVEVI